MLSITPHCNTLKYFTSTPIIKAQNTEHMHDMAQLQLKAQQESVAASRQLEDARKRAADATQNAALAIADIRSETSVSAQTTAAHFIETQAEAARATADATRKLAQVQFTFVFFKNVENHDSIFLKLRQIFIWNYSSDIFASKHF